MTVLAMVCRHGTRPAAAGGARKPTLTAAIRHNAEAAAVMLGVEDAAAAVAWAVVLERVRAAVAAVAAVAAGLGASPLPGTPGNGVDAAAVREAMAAPDARGRAPLLAV